MSDYLEFMLPSDHGGLFVMNSGTCNVDSASVKSCTFVSEKLLRIYFNYRMSSTVINGYITPFFNPPSTRGM